MNIENIEKVNTTNTLIKGRLARIVTSFREKIDVEIAKTFRENTKKKLSGAALIQAYQHAIRILQSRQRLIDREFLATYGPDDQMTAIAKLELSLIRQDDGTLFKLGTYQHQQGRLFCKACDTDDDGKGNPILLARLCPACHKGIQHVYTSLKEADVAAFGVNENESQPYARVFTCDACGFTDKYLIAKVPVVNQDTPPDRPATTIMLNTGR